MQSPFPGMDPYLESNEIWPDVHNALMTVLRDQLVPVLSPNYTAELETEIVIDQIYPPPPPLYGYPKAVIPDVTIMPSDRYTPHGGVAVAIPVAPLQLTIPLNIQTRLVTIYLRHRYTKHIVTVIELLSPVNKRSGKGRNKYLTKRDNYFDTGVHLIEIDLLRKYPRMPFGGNVPEVSYLVMVSNARRRPACDVWPIDLPQSLPVLPVPLMPPDPPVLLDLQQALNTTYQRARYDLRIDYTTLPEPPLTDKDTVWLKSLLSLV